MEIGKIASGGYLAGRNRDGAEVEGRRGATKEVAESAMVKGRQSQLKARGERKKREKVRDTGRKMERGREDSEKRRRRLEELKEIRERAEKAIGEIREVIESITRCEREEGAEN